MKKIFKKILLDVQWAVLRSRVAQYRRGGKQLVFILGTPVHNNIGDLAITCAEDEFINTIDNFQSVVVSLPLMQVKEKNIKEIIAQGDIIAGHGGGNMGDTYPREEYVRRFFVTNFPDNKVIILPQTIFFSDSKEGRSMRGQTQSIYADHKNLTLIAREKISYETMQGLFPENKVILTPDIVLSLGVKGGDGARKGILLCLRNDEERTLDNTMHSKIMEFAKKTNKTMRVTDTISDKRMIALRSKTKIVFDKFAEFQRSELVITDRLHGMVFAAITSTPCIVFSNFNHKVKGTYEWIKDLEYIQYCESIDNLEKVDVEKLMKSAKAYDPSRFDEYWKLIHKELKDK